MNDNKNTLRKLQNAEGKRLLELTRLEYSKKIIELLQKNPQNLSTLIYNLELTEKEFYDLLSGNKETNIILYEATLKEAYNLGKLNVPDAKENNDFNKKK